MERWSFSKIEATRGCKLAFEKRYIQNLPPDTEVLEFKEAVKVHEDIQEKFIKREFDYPILNPYIESNIAVEKEYKLFFEGEDIEFIACADIVLETEISRIILDIKTRYDSSIKERDKLQLMTYLALADIERPVAQNKVGIIAPYNQFMPVTLMDMEPPSFEFILEEIRKAKRRIPKMSVRTSDCAYCGYKRSCKYGLKAIDDGDIQAVAEKYLYLKAQVDMLEEILKKHTEFTSQKIRVGDKEIGFFERVITKINAPEFILLCEENNIPYFNVVKIDTTKAKQLAKKNDILSQAFEKEIKYVFATKKIEEDKE